MSFNLLESFFDRLFSPSKTKDTLFSKNFVGSHSLLAQDSGILDSLPLEIHKLLSDDPYGNLKSSTMNLQTEFRKNQFYNFGPLRQGLVSQAPKLFSPLLPIFLQETMQVISSEVLMTTESYLKSKFDVAEQNMILKSIKSVVPKLNLTVQTQCASDSITEKNLSPCSPVICAIQIDQTSKLGRMAPFVEPPPQLRKLNSFTNCSMKHEMANKKSKELQKRSKKRRRRQKKTTKSKNTLSNDTSPKETSASQVNEDCDNKICDIVSISGNTCSLQIVIPNLSSFYVSVEGGDDSDWDACSDNDWDNAEFEVAGLFMSSFTGPTISVANCPTTTLLSALREEAELVKRNCSLRNVNLKWNQMIKGWDKKPKSATKVMFAPDSHLVETVLVEMYERKGEWEVYATERLRFRRRIDELEKIISPCLAEKHRAKVFQKIEQTVL